MSKVIINNVELTLNLLDADVLEKFEAEMQSMSDTIQNPKEYDGMTTPQAMRKQCRIVEGCIDNLFGAGMSDKVFGGSNDLGAHMDAFGQIAHMGEDSNNEIRAISEKYGSARLANREQRRAAGINVVNGGKQHGHYNGKKRH